MLNLWRRGRRKVFISRSAFNTICEESARFSDLETGGILVGYHVGDSIVITAATGPGPRAKHRHDGLDLDLSHITGELNRSQQTPPLGYEGNWHSHPNPNIMWPSPTDQRLQRGILGSPDYDVDSVLLIIVPPFVGSARDLHCFVFTSGIARFRQARPIQYDAGS